MSFRTYLADRMASLFFGALTLAFTAMVLSVYGVEAGIVAFVTCTLVVGLAIAVLLDWVKRRRFWCELQDACEGLDETYYVCEVVARPGFGEGDIAWDTLERGTRAMREQIAAARRREREYREYAETWVHEIKTPIAAARLIAKNDPSPAVEAMDAQMDAIEGYVEQALYYARSTTLERDFQIRSVNLGEVVRQAVRAKTRPLIDARITPALENLDTTVRGDSKWLAFAIGQVLDNAAKYRDPNRDSSTVRIAAETVRPSEASRMTILSIADEGIGIPVADQGRIFDKGFTGENGRRFARSTGIGLYLVKTLCEKMGISTWIESEEGVGTTVYLGFPDSDR